MCDQSFATDKLISLQDALLKHYTKQVELSETDVIRYTAMAEVLKQVIQ